jgi:hypothetical protein
VTGVQTCALPISHEIVIKTKDTNRDPQDVNGWMLDLPFISVVLSLDKRKHPGRCYFSVSPELTGESSAMLCSTSLLPDAAGYNFMAIEMKGNRRSLMQMAGVVERIKRNA